LAAFVQPARTLLTLTVSVIFFLIWDVVGIGLGVFYTGQSQLITGVMLAPEMPLEEPFFLLLLCYSALILFVSLSRRRAKA
jgi:lycopene cyclase domain-containing protein